MNEKRAKMLTRLFIFGFAALFALFIAGIVTLRTCGSCRGKWKASRWSGDRTLWCEPGDVMVLKDKTVKHKNAEVRVKRGCKMNRGPGHHSYEISREKRPGAASST